MIGSARRTVERLGLTHRRLETEVAAGFIELLDGEATAAEAVLRDAYDELRDRGPRRRGRPGGGVPRPSAAAAGPRRRSRRVAAEAEELAGSDLKAAIAWRDVRAEAAARRGDTAAALALAREAVDLAAATDALLLVADARLTLATVLRAAGDDAAADAEARRAVEACEEKGATALAARARTMVRTPPEPATATHESAAPTRGAAAPQPRDGVGDAVGRELQPRRLGGHTGR